MSTSATTSLVQNRRSWTEWQVIRGIRLKSRPFDFVVCGIEGFIRHRTRRHAALLAHYGFLSVFPLLVVMTTLLGYALESDDKLKTEIVDSAFERVPFIGQQIEEDPTRIQGSALVLIVGLLIAIFGGTRAFVVAQTGMNDIWEIPEGRRPNFARTRARALLAIVVVGVAQIGSATVTAIVGISGVSWLNRILLIIAAVGINMVVLLAAYKVLTARQLSVRQLLPGVVFAGLGFSILQLIGTTIVQRAIRSASPVYGDFATVIAILTWLSLHALIALIGAEANAALDRRRHPATNAAIEPEVAQTE